MSITTALKARREQLTDREAGFTLIELLVVVIIIGILAAIAIPVYVGVQNNAKDSTVKSDLTNAKNAIVGWTQDNSTATALPALDTLKTYGYAAPVAGNYATGKTPTPANASTTANWCIEATSITNKVFNITTNGAVAAGVCSSTTTSW